MKLRWPTAIMVSLWISTALFPNFGGTQERRFYDFNQRWALLIGVGRYPEGSGIGKLDAPVNDVAAMKQMLIQYGGFAADNIVELLDESATYQGTNQAFQRLRAEANPDSLFLFYFSGRGGRIPDNVLIDETDQLDECLLLYDSMLEGGMPLDYISDDEIGNYLAKLGAKQSVVIVDASYQGDNAKEKGVTSGLAANLDGMSGDFLPPGTLVLEACAPGEVTSDGVFTSLLTQLVEQTGDQHDRYLADGIVTVRELQEYTATYQTSRLTDLEARASRVPLIQPLLPLASQPAGAEISVEGISRGMTPMSLTLPVGRHELEVRKRGYHVEIRSVQIGRPGEQKKVDVDLTPVRVTGVVRFRDSDLPLEGAMVMIIGARNTEPARTDEGGQFVFSDWSQNDLSERPEYEIQISDPSDRIQPPPNQHLQDLDDFTDDRDLGVITVDRRIIFAIQVVKHKEMTPMPNAVVLLGQQQLLDEDGDGVFEATRIGSLSSVELRVFQDGYETVNGSESYTQILPITLEGHTYTQQIGLTPATNTYLVEVSDQSGAPVSGAIVTLNGKPFEKVTSSEGMAEAQRRMAPDELKSLKLQKEGYALFDGSVPAQKNASHRYRLPIRLDIPQVSLTVTDASGSHVEGVEVFLDDQLTAKTDPEGKATIDVYRPPGTECVLGFVYEPGHHPTREETILQALEGGRFKLSKRGYAAEDKPGHLRVRLPIPGAINLLVMVQDQDSNPLPGLTVLLSGQDYGTTDETGASRFRARLDVQGDELSKIEFHEGGETYRPGSHPQFDATDRDQYTGLVTLQVPYGRIRITVSTTIGKKMIDLNVNARTALDGGAQLLDLPVTLQRVFPGSHRLRIEIDGVQGYSRQLRLKPDETISVPLTLPASEAWLACMLRLRDNPDDIRVLRSAEEMAGALGRADLVRIFADRRKQLQ